MATPFLAGINLARTEILNARIQNLATAPGSPLDGLIYYDTTTHKLCYYANGTWVDSGSNGGEIFTTAMMNLLNTSTNLNTNSAIVMRDASGNFSAGTITGALAGNASTATKLATSRTVSITGAGTGSASFDGSANASIALTLATVATAGTFGKVTINAQGLVTSGTSLVAADIPTLTLAKISDAGTAASKNTGTGSGNIPVLDGSGKLSTSILPSITITNSFPVVSQAEMLALVAETGDIAIRSDLNKSFILSTDAPSVLANWLELLTPTDSVFSVAGKTGTVTLVKGDVGLGNVDNTADSAKAVLSATKLATARAIALSGDATGTINFDGTAGVTIPMVLANIATAGTYRSVTINAKGQVTAGTNPTTLAGYGITDAAPSSHVGTGGAAHADATTSVDGFMTAADKTKLDGVATGANAYSHPANHPASVITQDSSNRFVSDAEKTSWGGKASKYSQAIGNGVLTTIVVTHGLGTQDVAVGIRETLTPFEHVMCDIHSTTVNTTTFTFANPPTSNQYTVTIVG